MTATDTKAITPADIVHTIDTLRRAHAETLSAMTQSEIVEIICRWARAWDTPSLRREAETLASPFPWSHVQVSLDGLTRSLTPQNVNVLIDDEDVRDARGVAVAGHVIAGNTPLLSWTSVLRGLLMRSASVVKLPSGDAGAWGDLFVRSLQSVSPKLAECVTLLRWPGGMSEWNAALCADVDMVTANGSDETIDMLRRLTPPAVPFIGYGHALSFALIPKAADWDNAAYGLARDVLLYDGGGCLSVKSIFVQGKTDAAAQFAPRLAAAMDAFGRDYGLLARTPQDWHALQEAQTLAALQPGAHWYAAGVGGVLVWPQAKFRYPPGAGIVNVQPWPAGSRLETLLAPVAGHVQGCAVAGDTPDTLRHELTALGVSRIAAPGEMQAPPFSWRQDGRDVLRVFAPRAA